MPAYPTHTLFSHLALQALSDARHPLASTASRHAALFRIAGIAGCDIQCMPYQICGHCDAPYRHDQQGKRTCLVCGRDALRDFLFKVSDGRRLTRRDIERDLYANTHLVLRRVYHGYGVSPGTPAGPKEQPFPRQVVQHLANCLRDAEKVARRRRVENYIAFTLGWFSHVVSDALFKGVYPHTVKVNFFGQQYGMKMLPAAETLTMTDISHDFGVRWSVWHDELEDAESDGGALKHLVMGDAPERYDPRYWTTEFGVPDPAIGRVMDAVQPLNRKWFRRMYVQPDYSAASPRLDAAPLSTRASWRFGDDRMDLGQVRRYALRTGWYETFTTGVSVYLRVLNEASELAGIRGRSDTVGASRSAGVPSWGLWERVVREAAARREPLDPEWGNRVRTDGDARKWLEGVRHQPVQFLYERPLTDYQEQLVSTLKQSFQLKSRRRAARQILIGSPAFCPAARELLCAEDALRFKYDHGLAALVRLNPERTKLLVADFSDLGAQHLAQLLH